MKPVGAVKLRCSGIVVSVAIFIASAAYSMPTQRTVDSENPSKLLNNLNRDFEVVEGPKEFLLPLAPLKILLSRHQQKTSNGDGGPTSASLSDLDYMVYGKVYLMKALGLADRSLAKSSSGETVVSTTDKQVLTTSDGISFPPTTKRTKRPYQYKYWNTPKPSDYKDFPDGSKDTSSTRKIEVRSVEREDQPQPVSSSPSSSPKTGDNQPPSTTTAPLPAPENDFSTSLDEEALDLLKKLMPAALAIHGTSGISSPNQNEQIEDDDHDDIAIPGNNSTNPSTSIELDNRFLISVPQKPNLSPCPEGQRRTHRGTCKPIFVHHPSPRDGIFAGRLTSPKMGVVMNNNESETGRRGGGGLQLSELFSSFIKIAKTLERTVKEEEQKLGQEVAQNEEKKDVQKESQNTEKQM